MLLHIGGSKAKSTITNIDEQSVSANAVDIRVSKIFRISGSLFTLTEQDKTHRKTIEVEARQSMWTLLEGVYEFTTDHQISVAEGEAAWLVARSTLNRNGVFITSGLYDSGFVGAVAGVLHVHCGSFRLQSNARIAQLILCKADTVKLYNGSYGIAADGTVKQEQQKYQ